MIMKEVYLITGNELKRKLADKMCNKTGVKILKHDLNDDFFFQEPQLWDVKDIALYSAEYACKKLKKPVITSDVGYYFDCFKHGFPGPYIKWVNQDLLAQDLLNLVKDKNNRRVTVKEGIAYVDPQGNKRVTEVIGYGILAHKAEGEGSSINQIVILDGMDKVMGLCTEEELLNYWSSRSEAYFKLGEYIASLNTCN